MKGPRNGHGTGAAFSLNMEKSNASPVIKLHSVGRESRLWQKAVKKSLRDAQANYHKLAVDEIFSCVCDWLLMTDKWIWPIKNSFVLFQLFLIAFSAV